jgi:AraC family transcriptional regulator of adaptative response / DNA-3-methyladenine glycosylase II
MEGVSLDPESCYRAMCAKDSRFDGLFFVGVETTGVYCRPVCPARTPRRDRCSFFRLPAEAERAGFRACFRCRPELAPGGAPIDRVPRLVRQAVTRIEAGYLNEASVDDLAGELGVSGRQLRRAMEAELGLSPVDLAQSRRLRLAKQLLEDTALPVVDIAFASGFSSVRRFNSVIRQRLGRSPTALRRRTRQGTADHIELRLDYRPPLDFSGMLQFLAARSLSGVERVSGQEYRRSVTLERARGWFAIRPDAQHPRLHALISGSLVPELVDVVARIRRLFDLDAQPHPIDTLLGRDQRLAGLVRRHPGLRPPGAFDAFEIAVRALLGQQVSLRAATTLAQRLVDRFGARLEAPGGIDRGFPTAGDLANLSPMDVARIGLPRQRARAIVELSRAVASGRVRLGVEESITQLRELPGIGEWTAEYIAMRALGAPDAFPAGDAALQRALGVKTRTEALALAERWRPFRAYAAMRLWASLTEEGRT